MHIRCIGVAYTARPKCKTSERAALRWRASPACCFVSQLLPDLLLHHATTASRPGAYGESTAKYFESETHDRKYTKYGKTSQERKKKKSKDRKQERRKNDTKKEERKVKKKKARKKERK